MRKITLDEITSEMPADLMVQTMASDSVHYAKVMHGVVATLVAEINKLKNCTPFKGGADTCTTPRGPRICEDCPRYVGMLDGQEVSDGG